MDPGDIAKALRASGLSDHVDYVLSIVRPVVFLHRSGGQCPVGASRFGGLPDLPPGTPWPHHAAGPYTFLAQIRFDEVPPGTALPDRGLLMLFAATFPEDAVFWQDPGYVRGLYLPNPGHLVPTAAPAAGLVSELESRLTFSRSLHLPQSATHRKDWPTDDPYDLLDALRNVLPEDPVADHLLGYPGQATLGYDPTPGPNWTPLLTVDSHDDLGWCWHDGDLLNVFVATDALAVRDFSILRSDAG